MTIKMWTLRGEIDLRNIKPNDIDIVSMCRQLAVLPRFNGAHLPEGQPISVAWHTMQGLPVVTQRLIEADIDQLDPLLYNLTRLAWLVHDLHEAITGDIATPVAKAAHCDLELASLKEDIDDAIWKHLGLYKQMKKYLHRIEPFITATDAIQRDDEMRLLSKGADIRPIRWDQLAREIKSAKERTFSMPDEL